MSADLDLAERLREKLAAESGVSEKTMFGGRAFLVDGHLAVAAGSQGGLLLRADPARSVGLITDARVSPFVMRGRELAGWLHVAVEADVDSGDLDGWVDQAVAHVRTLPP